jgi:regulatory protein
VKITSLSIQVRNKNRVNVSVDGKYRFSLEVAQIADLGLRVGKEYSEEELVSLEQESMYGKLYAQALEYSLIRPRSEREMRDYFYKKNRSRMVRNAKTGEVYQKEGISKEITDRVYARLLERGYVNDQSFARFWVENRQTSKGISRRKLMSELFAKGVSQSVVDTVLQNSERNDSSELEKVIAKKAGRYDDPQKLMAYLARLGFAYDDIKAALNHQDEF